jgi:hypothetical protein
MQWGPSNRMTCSWSGSTPTIACWGGPWRGRKQTILIYDLYPMLSALGSRSGWIQDDAVMEFNGWTRTAECASSSMEPQHPTARIYPPWARPCGAAPSACAKTARTAATRCSMRLPDTARHTHIRRWNQCHSLDLARIMSLYDQPSRAGSSIPCWLSTVAICVRCSTAWSMA